MCYCTQISRALTIVAYFVFLWCINVKLANVENDKQRIFWGWACLAGTAAFVLSGILHSLCKPYLEERATRLRREAADRYWDEVIREREENKKDQTDIEMDEKIGEEDRHMDTVDEAKETDCIV